MSIFHAFVLGLVQGVTEFLPISSSGFLIVIPKVLGWDLQSVAFDGVIHLATLAAIIIALWDEVKMILLQRRKILWWLVFATIPVLFVGFVTQEVFYLDIRSITIVSWSFILWGLVLLFADRYAKTVQDDIALVGWKRAFFIGLAQAIALIPGTSRSGITITAGMVSGLSRQTATTFSFLLGIPTIMAAGLLSLQNVIRHPEQMGALPLLVGGITAFVFALLTVKLLRRWLGHGTYAPLALARVLIGLFLLLWMG